jgi:hypothetical protein
MTYREADAEFGDLVSSSASLWETVKTTRFPQTYRAMFAFCAKTNCLKSAMFDLIDAGNSYAFKLVFRCFCEHYLKFAYLWIRFMQEKSDRVGVEYFSYCGAAETRDYVNAVVAAQAITGNTVAAGVAATITDMFPEGAGMSPRELDAVSSRFSYPAILHFLAHDAPSALLPDRAFLASIIPDYALLSSFVHGGPHTDLDTSGGPKALRECRERAVPVFQMTARVFKFTATAVSREFPDHGAIAAKVEAILNRLQSGVGQSDRSSSRSDDLDHRG